MKLSIFLLLKLQGFHVGYGTLNLNEKTGGAFKRQRDIPPLKVVGFA
jgi:hypothetical protein